MEVDKRYHIENIYIWIFYLCVHILGCDMQTYKFVHSVSMSMWLMLKRLCPSSFFSLVSPLLACCTKTNSASLVRRKVGIIKLSRIESRSIKLRWSRAATYGFNMTWQVPSQCEFPVTFKSQLE